MYCNKKTGGVALLARIGGVLLVTLAIGLGITARPAAAQMFEPFSWVANQNSDTVSVVLGPFQLLTVRVGRLPQKVAVAPDGRHIYVTNSRSNTVSVIDIISSTNPPAVTATVGVGTNPSGIAVSPDAKLVYVANSGSNDVWMINTTTSPPSVIAKIGVGNVPTGIVVSPDGKHVYVANNGSSNLSVIDTTTTPPSVVPVAVGSLPLGVGVSPDGKHIYVVNFGSSNVSVLDTTTTPPSVTSTVGVGKFPTSVAVAPDGKHIYVTNSVPNTVSQIDTTTNPPSVTATFGVGRSPSSIAITPDGQFLTVTNFNDNTVSVIDPVHNSVSTGDVGKGPFGVGIMSALPANSACVPFLAFNPELQILFGRATNTDSLTLKSSFTLSSSAPGINPILDAVTLKAGSFTATLPPGSFKEVASGLIGLNRFLFKGTIAGTALDVQIDLTGTQRYSLAAHATGASLTGTQNPVPVGVTIGGDCGMASVTAKITP